MLIEIKNLYKTYKAGRPNATKALSDINLQIKEGEMVAVMGTSGAGKSTLLHIMAGLLKFESGEYIFDGQKVQDFSSNQLCQMRNKDIGIVLQNFGLIDEYSVIFNIMIPLFFANGKNRVSNTKRKELAEKALNKVGIGKLKNTYPTEISGGEKQRCAIARAIINDPRIVLADEPTGNLDSTTSDAIMTLFKQLNNEGKTIILVTHDERIASKCKRIIKMNDGRIIEDLII